MRFLTVKQPYAWAIFNGKGVENRTQLFKYRGPVGIHAGVSWHEPGGEDPNVIDAAYALRPGGPGVYGLGPDHVWQRDPEFIFGAVIGVAELVDCHKAEPGCCDSQWGQHYPKATHLVLEDPMLLTEPVYIRGELGLWRERCDALPEDPPDYHHATCGLMRKVLERLPLAA